MERAAKWAALVVVAYLAWLLYARRVRGAAAGATAAAPPTAPPGPGGWHAAPTVDPHALPAPTLDRNVASDVPNGDVLKLDHLISDYDNHLSTTALYTELMRPASRVRLYADCPREVWARMFGLLALTLDRQLWRSQRYQLFQANITDQQTGQLVDSIVGGIVSTVAGIIGGPIVGALLKYAVNTQVQDLGLAIAQEGAVIDFVARLRQNAEPNKLPPSVQLMLQRPSTGHSLIASDPQSFVYRLAHALNMPDDVRETIGLEDFAWRNDSLGFLKDDNGKQVVFPAQWFTLTTLGLYLPWESSELIGADYQATVNMRARVLRALDAYACMVYPMAPDPSYQLYWYRNKVLGDICGSYFPPTDEDSQYVDAQGYRYAFNGVRVQMSPQQLATTAFTNNAGYTPDPTSPEARAGNGEQFETPGQALVRAAQSAFSVPAVAPLVGGATQLTDAQKAEQRRQMQMM